MTKFLEWLWLHIIVDVVDGETYSHKAIVLGTRLFIIKAVLNCGSVIHEIKWLDKPIEYKIPKRIPVECAYYDYWASGRILFHNELD